MGLELARPPAARRPPPAALPPHLLPPLSTRRTAPHLPPHPPSQARCPLCNIGFTHVWAYREVDGSYNDYLVESAVALLHCAQWFKRDVPSPNPNPDPDPDPKHSGSSGRCHLSAISVPSPPMPFQVESRPGGGSAAHAQPGDADDADEYHEMLQYRLANPNPNP